MSDEVLFPHVMQFMSRARSGERSGEVVQKDADTTALLAYYKRMNQVLTGQDYLAATSSPHAVDTLVG